MSDEENGAGKPECAFTLQLDTRVRNIEAGDYSQVALDLYRRSERGPLPIATAGASHNLLETEANALAWLERTKDIFYDELGPFVLNSLAILLDEASGRALVEMGLAPFTKQGLLRANLNLHEKLARERLGLEAGRPGRWRMEELAEEIAACLREIESPARHTYAGVAEKLRERHPSRAYKTGGSLRQAVRDFGIDWMQLKRAEAKRRKSA